VNIDGQHVLVTGGSQGIGTEIAKEFARRGATVTILGRNAERLAAVATEIGGSSVALDLADAGALDRAIAKVEFQVGPVDILINNAGAALVREAAAYAPGETTQLMMINAVAPMELTRQVLPGMVSRGKGHIVNISSLSGVSAVPHMAVYGAGKAALHHYTAAVQRELDFDKAPVGITLVTLGEVAGTQMMEAARQSPIIAAVSARLSRTKALPPIDRSDVAAAVGDAVLRNRRNVTVPRRIAPMIGLRNAPSRLQDVMLRGIG
jgi:short-subunit dehydrogenase